MIITLVASLGEDGSIGKSGKLLWKIPEDLQYFKELTVGGVVIMGRKTWESLPVRPLPERRNIVITRNPNYSAPGGEVFGDLRDALRNLKEEGIVHIIGGGEIYRQSINLADTLHLTRAYQVHPEADTFFPILGDQWNLFSYGDRIESKEGIEYRFETWFKKDGKTS